MVLSFPNKYTEEEQSLVVSHCKEPLYLIDLGTEGKPVLMETGS